MRQQGQNPSVIAYADKGSKRIKQKIAKLEKNGKSANVATTAGARELSCFIWGMMTGNIAYHESHYKQEGTSIDFQ